ncbi:DNA topoisomerase 3 [Campylobacter ureolyticus]|uniref:DNA topoisomerase 3 n=1 Tax=Campylobacter ureolyticus TaxID=827 RepID=UPI0022B4DD89|nr:DNA topoisomerase 3 [Campylobacter ureolyticus]MCZ6156839.1 DNA topoisomerase 3 [Campylobacter ureolyticus]
MKLFIAEKPALAKSIAAGIDGEYKNGDGFFQKGENIITWAFGHLLELYMPEDYDENFKKWDLKDLPLKIDEFKYKPIQSSKEQLKIICNLIKRSDVDTIINCGDADEEGQILIDEILKYANNKKPVLRLLLHDLTEKGVRSELKNMKSNNDFSNLSECGFARSIADWIVGINLTRAYTTKAQNNGYKGVISVGRVQTPILGLVVSRDLEREGHKSSFYYTLTGKFKTHQAEILANLKTDEKITDENEANEIKNICLGKNGILNVTNENKLEYPPLPYNLLNLQADCSKKFNFKPDKTLKITQDLREKYKCITYNRSDCEYLPVNMWESSTNVLNSIKSNLSDFENIIKNADPNLKSRAFNDEFITAHFAIIPTETTFDFNSMSKDEQNVYKLISKRYIAQFYEPMQYLQTNIEILINDYKFTTSKKKITKNGYLSLFSGENDSEQKNDDEVENSFDLSLLESGNCQTLNIEINKKQTKPKPYYTMPTLLKDLTSISKYVKDEKIKTLLKEKDKDKKGENGGIGTPATRSEHIKNLFEREYIREEKKSIISTKKGRDLIALAPKILSTPDMTALWYEQQLEIQNGNLSRDDFLNRVFDEVEEQIELIKNNALLDKNFNGIDKTYPCKCGKGFLQKRHSQKTGKDFWGCSNWKNGCSEIYPDLNGKPNIPKYFCPKCGSALNRWKNKKGDGYYWSCSGWKTKGCQIGFINDKNGKPEI